VKQVQDTRDGTPIFELAASVGLFSGDGIRRHPLMMSRAVEEFRIPAPSRPVAVLLDPDHDLLREVRPPTWSTEALMAVFKSARHASDREMALDRLLQGEPSDEVVRLLADALAADRGAFPVLR